MSVRLPCQHIQDCYLLEIWTDNGFSYCWQNIQNKISKEKLFFIFINSTETYPRQVSEKVVDRKKQDFNGIFVHFWYCFLLVYLILFPSSKLSLSSLFRIINLKMSFPWLKQLGSRTCMQWLLLPCPFSFGIVLFISQQTSTVDFWVP